MKNEIITSLKVFFVLSALLGIIYPVVILIISQTTMHHKANGSLLFKDGLPIGSELIGQSFTDPKYLHPRPSANNYNGIASGSSNFGPTSRKMIEQVEQNIIALRSTENLNLQTPIPAGMVLQSASGLDPHISTEDAQLQITRIAKTRNLTEDIVIKLLKENTDTDLLGIWGQTRVNVLKLNLALDTN